MADDDGGGTSGFEEGKGDESLRGGGLNVVPLHADPWLAPNWPLTHEAVVKIFRDRRGEDFLYFKVMGEAFRWTGHVWENDQCCIFEREVAALCRDIGATQKKKTPRAKVEGSGFIAGCVSRLRQELAASIDKFDKAEVFNMRTAAVSLKANGSHWTAGAQRREDFCSKMAGVTAMAGPCPMWLAFLDQITEGDADMVAYLQRVAGYCATPFTSEQAFFFFYGSGGNGKGAFLRTLAAVLGDYAATASLELFLASKFEQHTEELAALRGVRLVVASETGAGRHWNESKIKQISGGDPVRARFMRQNSFEYWPTYKIVVSGNDQPTITDAGPALRRRLQLVPFNVRVTPDPTFEKRMLEREGPAILAWVLDGVVTWRERGLDPPAAVVAATEEYFEEQDERRQWFDACCRLDTDWWEPTETAFQSWRKYAMANGVFVGTKAATTRWIKATHKLASKYARPKGGGEPRQCLMGMAVAANVDESVGSSYRDS